MGITTNRIDADSIAWNPVSRWRSCFLLVLSLLLGTAQSVLAEDESIAQDIRQKIEAINADGSLLEDSKTELLGQLESALTQLDKAETFDTESSRYQTAADNAKEEVRRFEAKLAEAQARPIGAEELVAAEASLEEIEGQISLVESERAALIERRSELLSALEGWPARHEVIQHRLLELPGLIDQSLDVVEVPADTLQQEVRQLSARAKVRALRAEQRSLKQELIYKPASLEVHSAERDWLVQAVASADLKLRALNEAAEAARSAATRDNLESVLAIEEELADHPPELAAYAQHNREMARSLDRYVDDLGQARSEGARLKTQSEDIEQEYAMMQRRLEFAGRMEVLGRAMLTRLESLPNTRQIQRQIRARNDLIAERSLSYFDAEEELWAINSRQHYVDDRFPAMDLTDRETANLVERLVDQRQQLLDDTNESLRTLVNILVENNEIATGLVEVTDTFHQFLVGNLIWVRNFEYFNLKTLYAQFGTVLSPTEWAAVPSQLITGYQQHDWSLMMVILTLLVLALRPWMKSVYRERLGNPALLNIATLLNIILCLLLSFAIALPWPLLLYVVGFFLSHTQPSTAFLDALAPALMSTAIALHALLLARLLMRPTGVGRRLLKWNTRILDVLRRELKWAGPVVLLALLLDSLAYNLNLATSGGPVGAIAVGTIAVTLVVFSLRLLRVELFHSNPNTRHSLRLTAALAAGVILMLMLGLLFAAGTYLAALGWSILTVLAIKVVTDVLKRALLILRARLVRRSKEEIRAREEEGENALEAQQGVDMDYLSEAHAKLLSIFRLVAIAVALWLIWSPSLPALNLFQSIALGQVVDATDPVDGMRTITLLDVIVGVTILVLTALVARHLPSIVQLFLMEWVKISAGARYATGILLQYVVVAVGASMFFSTLGWEWSRLQWLVAALGVGIGFGLQEIVANFISGIIILFEQPIRVGDIITAGGAEGTVKKISARATVIQTFDGKEHLIPNKELITGQVVNWSLTDNAVRVVIPVGIAYGSDVRRAMELLVEAAGEVELVLTDPEPRATFEDFGDNALVLWLRCFVAEDRLRAWTELRTRINDKFNQAGIIIAFPQRDLHLDFADALKVELSRGDGAAV